MSAENYVVNELLEHFEDGIPEEAFEFAKKTTFKNNRYLFVGKGDKPETFCTHCHHWYFESKKVKAGSTGTCPNCNVLSVYKHEWRSRKTLFEQAYILFAQKSSYNENVVTLTWYYAIDDFRGDYTKETLSLKPVARMLFDCDSGESYLLERWHWSDSWANVGKIVTPYTLRNHNIQRSVCVNSVINAVEDTKLTYSNWGRYALDDIAKYFALTLQYPSIEILSKAGKTEVVKSKMYEGKTYSAVNWRATKLHNIFKVSKQDYEMLEAAEADLLEYWLWQQSRKEKSKMSFKELRKRSNECQLDSYMSVFKFIRKYTTIHRIFNYVEKQFTKAKEHYRRQGQVLITWKDYIEDCQKLKLNLSEDVILFPRDLEQAHQETMKRIKHVEDELMRKRAFERKKQLEKYEFTDGFFLIKAPYTAKEIIDEGSKLSHCVGSYANRYVEGKTTILFLRDAKKPDEPYYTIELNGKEDIVQVRGFKNKSAEPDVERFIELFKKTKLKKKKQGGNKREREIAV